MKELLINHQALPGLAKASSMRHRILSGVLLKLTLTLLALFSLPSIAWGETVTKTYDFGGGERAYDASSVGWEYDATAQTVWQYAEGTYFPAGARSLTSLSSFPSTLAKVTIVADSQYGTSVTINGVKKELSSNINFRLVENHYEGNENPQTIEFENITHTSSNLAPLKIEFDDLNLFYIKSITVEYESVSYGITVGGTRVMNDNAADIFGDGTASYDKTTETLTLKNATLSKKIRTSNESLTIDLQGKNSISDNDTCAIASTTASKTIPLTFKSSTSPDGELTLNNVIYGFDNEIDYQDNLEMREEGGNTVIAPKKLEKPFIFSDGETGKAFGFEYDLENTEVIYSIDYANESLTDVKDAAYNGESVPISGACTVTAYTKKGNLKSEVATAKYFGFTDNIEVPYQVSANAPNIAPTLPDGATVTYSYNGINDLPIATIDESTGVITINSIGNESFKASFTIGEEPDDYSILNDYNESGQGLSLDLGSFTLTVTPKDVSDKTITIASIEDQSFTGSNITPTLTVMDGEKTIIENTDYTVSYMNNTDAGTATATITGKGNYTGTQDKAFTITPKDLSKETIVITLNPDELLTYTGSEIKPTVSSVAIQKGASEAEPSGSTIVIDSKYYEVTGYNNNINAASAEDENNPPTLQITFKGNYSGTANTTFTINKASISPEISITGWTYGDEPNTPTVTEKSNPGKGEILAFSYAEEQEGIEPSDLVYSTDVPTQAGHYLVIASVAETANYLSGEAKGDFTIAPKSVENVVITLSEEPLVYHGRSQCPTVLSVTDGETTLNSESDFILSCEGYVDAGDHQALILGEGNYTGEKPFTFTITPKSITDVTVQLVPDVTYTYNTEEHTPQVTVIDGKNELTLDTDFTLSCSNNINAGSATCIVVGKGNYTGEKNAPSFTIEKADFSGITIAKIPDQAYTGLPISPAITVTFMDKPVAETEYKPSYDNNVELGTEAKVTLISNGNNFTFDPEHPVIARFSIVQANTTITTENTSTTYNTQPQAYTGAKADDGTIGITYYSSEEDRNEGINGTEVAPTNAGTYYIRATQTDNHYVSEPADATYTINPATITKALLDKQVLIYNGEEQTTEVVEVDAGSILVDPTYYTVSGNSGTEAGVYTVTVTAVVAEGLTNNFTGSTTTTFEIKNRSITESLIGFAEGQTTATYYNQNEDFDLPEGIVAYIITGVNGTNVTTQRLSYIPKDTPVLVEKTASSETVAEVADGNMLEGTTGETQVGALSGNVYLLYKNEFVKATSGVIPAGRGFLLLSNAIAPAGTRGLGIEHGEGYGEDTTGIQQATAEEATSGSEAWYTIDGLRVDGKPAKTGLYIKNGKKIVVK